MIVYATLVISDYATTQAIHLKVHKESKHECVRYPCDQFDYPATEAGSKKIHKSI